jgi:hypothetical protein
VASAKNAPEQDLWIAAVWTPVSDFDIFWAAYPLRSGRLAAEREYRHARQRTSADVILAGVQRYLEHLPREARYIKKPENWIRDGCWMDEYDEPVLRESFPDCDHEPRCNSKQWCAVLRSREQAS